MLPDDTFKKEIQRTFSGATWESKVGYCRAIRMGKIIAVTGTISLDAAGEIHAPDDPYQQAKRCLEIIERAIKPLGAERRQIIRTRMFVTDISQWQEFGRAHGEFFADYPPATSMLEIKALIDSKALIEIEADAVVL
ncbi:MAG: RidA family protein [Bdellovibrionota bacterium]